MCCVEAGQRVGLFDGLSQRCSKDSAADIHQATENISMEPLQTLPLLIPAKHVAVISAVRSSPPPDLGLPMAQSDAGAATNPNGPPVLEPELERAASGSSDSASATAPADVAKATVADCATSLTSVPTATSESRVMPVE